MAAVSSSSLPSDPVRRRIDSSGSSSDDTSIIKRIDGQIDNDTADGLFAKIASYFNGPDYASFLRLNKRIKNRMMNPASGYLQAERIRIRCSSLYKRLRAVHSDTEFVGPAVQIPSVLKPSVEELRPYHDHKTGNRCDIVQEFVRSKAEFCGRDLNEVFGFLDRLDLYELADVRSTEGFPVADLIDENRFSEFMNYFPNLEEIKYLKSFKGGINLDETFPVIPRLKMIRALHLSVYSEDNTDGKEVFSGLKSLFEQIPNLRSLTLQGELEKISFDELPHPEQLEHLSLSIESQNAVDGELCELIGRASNLQSVVLENVKLNRALEKLLLRKHSGDPVKLTTLRLKEDVSVSSLFLSRLSQLSLETLEIPYEFECDGATKCICEDEFLEPPKSLKSFVVSTEREFYTGFSKGLYSSVDVLFNLLKKMKELRYLYFVPIQGTEEEKKPDEYEQFKAQLLADMFEQPTDDFSELRSFNLLTVGVLERLKTDELINNILQSLPKIDDLYKHRIRAVLNNPECVVSDPDPDDEMGD